MSLDNMEKRLRLLEDEAAIRSVIQRYGRAVDWLSTEDLDLIFFDDAEIDYGAFGGAGAEFKQTLQEVEAGFPRRWHFTGSIEIAWVDENTVDVESSQIVGSATSADLAADYSLFFGWYLDRLERRNGRWGISRREGGVSALSPYSTELLSRLL
ncbi:MAG: nuclear transport factor 2 family protein [Sphingomonadaceae bacterium]